MVHLGELSLKVPLVGPEEDNGEPLDGEGASHACGKFEFEPKHGGSIYLVSEDVDALVGCVDDVGAVEVGDGADERFELSDRVHDSDRDTSLKPYRPRVGIYS